MTSLLQKIVGKKRAMSPQSWPCVSQSVPLDIHAVAKVMETELQKRDAAIAGLSERIRNIKHGDAA